MTNFYVCLRAAKSCGTCETTHYEWHAGITDQQTYKARSDLYVDCILWEEFSTRKEALEFESWAEGLVGAVFFEENNKEPGLDEEENAWKYEMYNSSTGDTPSSVDALVVAAVYRKMLLLWDTEEKPSRSAWLEDTEDVVKISDAEWDELDSPWAKTVIKLREEKKSALSLSPVAVKQDMW